MEGVERVNVPIADLTPMSLSAALQVEVSFESEYSRFFKSISTTDTASAAFPCDVKVT